MESYKSLELWIKTLTLVGVVIGGIWAAVTYVDIKEKEYYAEFWNKKMELFLRTSKAASTMAITNDLQEFNDARDDFWELYYGELSLVEGACVKKAMIVFSDCVPKKSIKDKTALPLDKLSEPAYRLTRRLQEELANAWQAPFSELRNHDDTPKECNFPVEEKCLPQQ